VLAYLAWGNDGCQLSFAQRFQDAVGVVSAISQTMSSVDEIEKLFSESRLVLLSRGQSKLDGLPAQGDNRVELRRKSATRSPESIDGRSTAAACRVLVRPDDSGVEDRAHLLLNRDAAKQVFPPTATGPIPKAIVDCFPGAKPGIQVAPGCTGSCQPHHGINEIAVPALGFRATLLRNSGRNRQPLLVRQGMSIHLNGRSRPHPDSKPLAILAALAVKTRDCP
jgi:hypothetical protein